MAALLLPVAFVLDLILGDPRTRFHPVRLIGSLIAWCERHLYKEGSDLFLRGSYLAIISLLTPIAINTLLFKSLKALSVHLLWAYAVFLMTMMIALKDLLAHVRAVTERMEKEDLPSARLALSMIVGRNTETLDSSGIRRALIETLSENFVDGLLSPMFWFCIGLFVGRFLRSDPLLFGLNFMLFYKITNTLDSMVGYRNERYEIFGRLSARLDDALNFIPARLSILFLAIGAHACSLDWKSGLRIAKRDRLKHQSPNSAHAESFLAGALNISLGGPARYEGQVKERPWIGTGPSDFGPEKVSDAMVLITLASVLAVACFTVLGWVFL